MHTEVNKKKRDAQKSDAHGKDSSIDAVFFAGLVRIDISRCLQSWPMRAKCCVLTQKYEPFFFIKEEIYKGESLGVLRQTRAPQKECKPPITTFQIAIMSHLLLAIIAATVYFFCVALRRTRFL